MFKPHCRFASRCFTKTGRTRRRRRPPLGVSRIPTCQTDRPPLFSVTVRRATFNRSRAVGVSCRCNGWQQHKEITWKLSDKKSHPIIQRGGRGAVVCCLPDGIDSRVTALVVFDELCDTKAKHLEPPCGLSIWPSPYLPEPDAPKQL